jgi:hypothetical protein
MSKSRAIRASALTYAAVALLLAAVVAVAAPSRARARAAIHVSPKSVVAGDKVRVYGSARGGCKVGDLVTLISRAFPRQTNFAGLPAISTTLGRGGSFSVSVAIPARVRPGRYRISGRCGGGNLGAHAALTVRH